MTAIPGLPRCPDLTRWNRASRSRFDYVDGNAATWLEELRLKHLSLFLRGAEDRFRDPGYWRLLFSEDKTTWPPATELADLRDDALVWKALWQAFPAEPETNAYRNDRLAAAYAQPRGDHTVEINRALARALHVLLGHVQAYANEGAIRTATQWDNVRKLAALVDYQPAPPASASTDIALLAKDGVSGAIVDPGLAFRYAPPDGGKPQVFETIKEVTVDADLNAARALNWRLNTTPLPPGGETHWVAVEGAPEVDPGAVVVIAPAPGFAGERLEVTAVVAMPGGPPPPATRAALEALAVKAADDPAPVFIRGTLKPGEASPVELALAELRMAQIRSFLIAQGVAAERIESRLFGGQALGADTNEFALGFDRILQPIARIVTAATLDEDETCLALTLDEDLVGAWRFVDTELHAASVAPRSGRLGAVFTGAIVVEAVEGGTWERGQIIAWDDGGTYDYAVVLQVDGTRARLSKVPQPDSDGALTVLALARFEKHDDGRYRTSTEVAALRFARGGTIERATGSAIDADPDDASAGTAYKEYTGRVTNRRKAYAEPLGGETSFEVKLLKAPVAAFPGSPTRRNAIFDGSAPVELVAGNFMVARPQEGGAMTALRVLGVRQDEGSFTVSFADDVPIPVEDQVFYGPFKARLRPKDYDRNPGPAITGAGTVVLTDLGGVAARLLKPGRSVLVEDERADGGVEPQVFTIGSVERNHAARRVTLAFEEDGPFDGFVAGWTVLRGNTVTVSHGETKGSMVLGSGDGERAEQSFHLDVADLSYEPDPTSPTGVAPAIEVTVEGMIWSRVARRSDAAAGDPAYLTRTREDRTLDLVFLRRLPSGTNNVKLSRHRIGSGTVANDVPPFSFKEPMKPHPDIDGLRQPFVTAGGADPEAVSAMREQAPRELKALDRAVTLEDFATIAASHASVAQALADGPFPAGRLQRIAITVVPESGSLSDSLLGQIQSFVASRALPGTFPEVGRFVPLPVTVALTLRFDPERYDLDEVREAAEAALAASFALDQRKLGAALYLSELLAAAERVTGVLTAQAVLAPRNDAPAPRRAVLSDDNVLRALFAKPEQVIFIESAADVTVTMEAVE